jgi:hypothetical protein
LHHIRATIMSFPGSFLRSRFLRRLILARRDWH